MIDAGWLGIFLPMTALISYLIGNNQGYKSGCSDERYRIEKYGR